MNAELPDNATAAPAPEFVDELDAAPAEDSGPEFEVARVFDFADPTTGPGFEPGHRLIADPAERERLLGYLRGGAMVMMTTARMHDVLDPEQGQIVPMTFRTDGTWIWTDTVAYYLASHGMAPDPRLAAHIEQMCAGGQAVPSADLATATRAADFMLNPPAGREDTAVWTVGS